MRSALFVVAAIGGCISPADPEIPAELGPRYISIGADALVTARTVASQRGDLLQLLETDGEIAVISFEAEDLEALSEQMHEQHHRCGGFVLHESLDEARAVLHHDAEVITAAVDYALDQAATVQAVLPALDSGSIRDTIGELSKMKNRYYQSETGAAASIWLRDRWRSFTTRTDVTVELFDHGYAQKSVILTISGSTRANEVVVLGGHLDSIARGGHKATAPGADDDASGIATLTEVARVLLANNYRPARTIKLMAYAAEEVGLRGSQGIVRHYMKGRVNVVGALQLDMTNYQGSDKDIWLMKDFTNAAQNTFVTNLIDTYVGATWGLDACGYACSDHATWYRAGVPVSMPFESRMRQRNMSIHTIEDTLEISGNNAAHALKFARLGAAYAIELGKGELGPASISSVEQIGERTVPEMASRDAAPWQWFAAILSALGLLVLVRWTSRWM